MCEKTKRGLAVAWADGDVAQSFVVKGRGWPHWTAKGVGWNSVCEVCDEGGSLGMCDFCNVVYHNACLPKEQRQPTGSGAASVDWACPARTIAQAPGCDEPNVYELKTPKKGTCAALKKIAAQQL